MNQRTEQAIHKLINEGLFFSVNKNMLALHFLKDVLGINVFQLNIEEVSKEICVEFDYALEELPDEKEELYKFVAERIMGIKAEQEPYQAFNHEVFLVMEDLKKIKSMIQDYELKQKDSKVDRYTRIKYEYLVEKLSVAKNEICEYLAENINLRVCKELIHWGEAYSYADYVNLNQNLTKPYSFRGNEEEYSMSVFDGLNYKFKYMSLRESKEIKRLYIENEEEFYMLVDEYVYYYEISDRILSIIEGNHFLSKRVMLKQAIENFKEGRFEISCQIIPLQIEGIIYDYCIELKVPHTQLERLPLDQKVDHIVDKDSSFMGHEYFKYDFIELRNAAAHGRLHTTLDYKNTANMLLLDLLYLCEFVDNSEATVTNRMRHLFNLLEKESTPLNVSLLTFEFIASYKDEQFPSFYKKDDAKIMLDKYAHSNDFFSFLRTMVLEPSYLIENEKINKKLEKVLIYLKKSKECEEEGKRLLRRLSEINKNSKIDTEMFK
ncbi:hypothetical protein CT694_35235 (plasmid) [Bacillus wiedmannii bv. thuringiensis]|nr:hypothetical protein CT694_35235 [Bacillus wiedmannii bv. thuringiensis]